MPAATGLNMKAWQNVFQELIQEVKPWHPWTLTLDSSCVPNIPQPGWSQYQQWAFARFKCSSCSHSWASAQVQVLFHMHWNKIESKGQVKMRVFTQRCKKCSRPTFEVPEFTEENVSRILNNLVLRILKNCYREGFKSMEEIPTIKDSSLEGPHDVNNCEACLQGFCVQSRLDPAKPPPMSPSLPTISSPNARVPLYKLPPPPRSNTTGDTATGNTRVKKGKVLPTPWVPEPPLARNPRVNTSYQVERVIHDYSPENSYSPLVQDRRPCCSNVCCYNSSICCCLVILIIIAVVWLSLFSKTTL